MKKALLVSDAQKRVKEFTQKNGWVDEPNIDKFDHLHEELIEMSKYLRYHTLQEREQIIRDEKEVFLDGIGDLFFGLCRLANQLDVDISDAFSLVTTRIKEKYDKKGEAKGAPSK